MTAAEILGIRDIQEESITIPEWGGATFLVRGLTAQQRAEVVQSATDSRGVINVSKLSAGLVIEGLCDPETRKPVFERAHRDAIMGKSASAIEAIGSAVARLSKMLPADIAGAEKNSSAGSDTSTLQ